MRRMLCCGFGGKSWDLLYDRSRYRHPPTEDHFGERPLPGMTADFPHKMPDAGARNYVRLVSYSPFGIEITLDAARLILADEKLGQGRVPRSAGDQPFLERLRRPCVRPGEPRGRGHHVPHRPPVGRVRRLHQRADGERPWLFVLTADHGVAPIPERTARLKIAAQRDPLVMDGKEGPGSTHQMLEAHLREKLGVREAQPGLVLAVIESQIYLRADHPALKGAVFAEAQRLTRDWLLAQPRVAAAVTREQILSGGLNGPLAETALRRSFHPRRSGDVLFCLEPYDIQGKSRRRMAAPGTTIRTSRSWSSSKERRRRRATCRPAVSIAA